MYNNKIILRNIYIIFKRTNDPIGPVINITQTNTYNFDYDWLAMCLTYVT